MRTSGISLTESSIFDYGFGAGTFFLQCSPNARIGGCEIEERTVKEVENTLRLRGFQNFCLGVIELGQPEQFLRNHSGYDVVLCSHVLEHIPDPVPLMRLLADVARPGGHLIFLVPINERFPDAHHEHKVTADLIKEWTARSGMECTALVESDPWTYPFQRFVVAEHGWKHRVAQGINLFIGILASLVGPLRWSALSDALQSLPLMKPVQCGFVLKTPTVPGRDRKPDTDAPSMC